MVVILGENAWRIFLGILLILLKLLNRKLNNFRFVNESKSSVLWPDKLRGKREGWG